MKRYFLTVTGLLTTMMLVLPLCFAGKYDLKKITPEIDRALKSRQARYARVQELKKSGVIGEDNRGFVATLRNDAKATDIASAENRDRRVIYQALVDQNALGPGGMAEVERVFAEVQRDKASPGENVQTPSGRWEKK